MMTIPAPMILRPLYTELAEHKHATDFALRSQAAIDAALLTTDAARGRSLTDQSTGRVLTVRQGTMTSMRCVPKAAAWIRTHRPDIAERFDPGRKVVKATASYVRSPVWDAEFSEYAGHIELPYYRPDMPWPLLDHRAYASEDVARRKKITDGLRAELAAVIEENDFFATAPDGLYHLWEGRGYRLTPPREQWAAFDYEAIEAAYPELRVRTAVVRSVVDVKIEMRDPDEGL